MTAVLRRPAGNRGDQVGLTRVSLDVQRIRAGLGRGTAPTAEQVTTPRPGASAGPRPMDERAVTMALMAELTERASRVLARPSGGDHPDTAVAHPLVTSANLGHLLDQATGSAGRVRSAVRWFSPRGRRAIGPQADFDETLVHCIHQLEHRTQWQELRIRELEARLNEVTRSATPGPIGGQGRCLAVVHADHGVLGGFERHLAMVVRELEGRGWSVEVIGLDARRPRTRLFGLPIEPIHFEFHRDYFAYLSLVAQAAELDLDRFDVVLTTQPPTYLVRHDRKVALFYHQARQFYDLVEPYVASRFAEEDVHRAAVASVRAIDEVGRSGVAHWLAGSATVADRLASYWDVDAVDTTIYHAPPACTVPEQAAAYDPDGPILHVGRMEWPKRPELAVQAVHLLSSSRAVRFVGGGSRAEFVASLDVQLTAAPAEAAGLSEQATWLNRGIFTAGWRPRSDGPGRIEFLGPVDDAERDRHYREASVVVVPAHAEDYGLTALEAMAFARPVVVCADGGGLTELVEHEVTGLVVEATPEALAAAIDRLLADPGLAAELGRAGHRRVQALDGDASLAMLDKAMERAGAG